MAIDVQATPEGRLEKGTVLIVDDMPNVALALSAMTRRLGHECEIASGVEEALATFARRAFDVVLSDVKMGTPLDGFDLLEQLHERAPNVPVILITGEASVTAAMQAVEAHAYDYLSKPLRLEPLQQLLQRAILRKRMLERVENEAPQQLQPFTFNDIQGKSPLMLAAFTKVARAARGKTPVLILGESGTGKERVARTLHEKSERADRAFVSVNIAAVAPHLAESELFGHRRGAYTDAREEREGLFEQANGGTLFLDEIGEIELAVQVKLLRVIQEGIIRRVGGNDDIKVDVRLITATSRDLPRMVEQGTFRQDLFFRINTISIPLPPLRERPEDIEELATFFVAREATQQGKVMPRLAPEAIAALKAHPWPGNVRELENTMSRAVLFSTDGIITPDILELDQVPVPGSAVLENRPTRWLTMDEKMLEYALEVLGSTGGNVSQAAKILGKSRRTLQRMVARARRREDGRDEMTQGEQF